MNEADVVQRIATLEARVENHSTENARMIQQLRELNESVMAARLEMKAMATKLTWIMALAMAATETGLRMLLRQ